MSHNLSQQSTSPLCVTCLSFFQLCSHLVVLLFEPRSSCYITVAWVMPLTAVYSKTLIKRKRRMMGNKTLKGGKKGQWTQIESYGDSKLKSICAWASRFIASWPAEVEFFILSRENRRVQIWNWATLGSFKLENVQPVCHMRHHRALAVVFFLLEGVCPARRSWGLQPEQLMREAGRLAARWLESWTRRFKCIIWTLACWGVSLLKRKPLHRHMHLC